MNYDFVDLSDISPNESLRQSELVNRLVKRIVEDGANCIVVQDGPAAKRLEGSIIAWLLDNNLVIRKDVR